MKRLVLLILAIMLMTDLAEDGYLGKVKLVAPTSSAKTFLKISPLLTCSGKIYAFDTLLSDRGEISRLMQFKPLTHLFQPALKIIIYNHTGSSGGIPL
jgi:hypothetical protein